MPDACVVPPACAKVVAVANFSTLCDASPLRAGRCYGVLGGAPFPRSCTLAGPSSGAAVFVPAEPSDEPPTLGNITADIQLTGGIQLTRVRLEARTLNVTGAQVGICPNMSTDGYDCSDRGGSVYTQGAWRLSAASNVSLSLACAVDGGGAYIGGTLALTDRSWLHVTGAFAQRYGGGLYARKLSLAGQSGLDLSHTFATSGGGGLYVERLASVLQSTVLVVGAMSFAGGGGLQVGGALDVAGSLLRVSPGDRRSAGASRRLRARRLQRDTSGDLLSIGDATELRNQSLLRIEGGPVPTVGAALRTAALHLLDGSRLALEGFTGGYGVSVGPAYAWDGRLENSSLHVQRGSSLDILRSSASAALVALNTSLQWPGATRAAAVNFSNVWVENCSSPVARITGGGQVAVADVTVSFDTSCETNASSSTSSCSADIFAFQGSVRFEGVAARCPLWASGCELLLVDDCAGMPCGRVEEALQRGRLQLASGAGHALCPRAVAVPADPTSRCSCRAPWGWSPAPAPATADDGDAPAVGSRPSAAHCAPCGWNTWYDKQSSSCLPCPWYLPWSAGESSRCLPVPVQRQDAPEAVQFLWLFVPSLIFVALSLWLGVLISSPLHIADMTWTSFEDLTTCSRRLAKARARAKKEGGGGEEGGAKGALLLTVQGPLVECYGVRWVMWRFLRYRVVGSGAYGVDYQRSKHNVFRLQARSDRTVLLVGEGADLNRASSQGCLQVERWKRVFAHVDMVLAAVILLPAWWVVVIYYDEGHRVGPVALTLAYMVAVLALMAWPSFWLWRRLHARYYSKTALTDLHKLYRKAIRPEPYQGPDANHPQHAGVTAGVLFDTFNHYKVLIRDRNMHYVVANIVLPLTKPGKVSFATLWGGRTVMYFVSHSWNTVHSVFVSTIRNHAQCSAGDDWGRQTYWICSFSNNQWDISAALGETVMESAFARVLRGGLARGVVMVLDAEVQPLHRVWCLFEVLVSHAQNLKIEYATAMGVIGDPRCASVDVPLAIASRVKGLQVADCESSSPEDKRKILAEVTHHMGSLEAMDKHISRLIATSVAKGFRHTQEKVQHIVKDLGAVPEAAPFARMREQLSSAHGPGSALRAAGHAPELPPQWPAP